MDRHEKRARGTNDGKTDVFEVRMDGKRNVNPLLSDCGGDDDDGSDCEVCDEDEGSEDMVNEVRVLLLLLLLSSTGTRHGDVDDGLHNQPS